MNKKIDPLKQLVKSNEWMDGYRAGEKYGISKERRHPQALRFGVEIKIGNRPFIVKKFPKFQQARDWAIWNYKKRIDYFSIINI